jgi:hypothetical protein
MRKLARVATALILAAVVLGGCGDDAGDAGDVADDGGDREPSVTPTPTETVEATDWGKPAKGPKVTGEGYTYRVPTAWADVTKQARKMQASVDTAASEKAATDGFADNISVGYQATAATLDELAVTVQDQLEPLVKDLSALDHVTIDGVEALRHSGPASSAGRSYFLEQFVALRDGRVAIITFSLGRSLPVETREGLVASVMASWSWAE